MQVILPKKAGTYLFYFGHADDPYYEVDYIDFSDPIDEDDTDLYYYLDQNRVYDVSAWWELPQPNKMCNGGGG